MAHHSIGKGLKDKEETNQIHKDSLEDFAEHSFCWGIIRPVVSRIRATLAAVGTNQAPSAIGSDGLMRPKVSVRGADKSKVIKIADPTKETDNACANPPNHNSRVSLDRAADKGTTDTKLSAVGAKTQHKRRKLTDYLRKPVIDMAKIAAYRKTARVTKKLINEQTKGGEGNRRQGKSRVKEAMEGKSESHNDSHMCSTTRIDEDKKTEEKYTAVIYTKEEEQKRIIMPDRSGSEDGVVLVGSSLRNNQNDQDKAQRSSYL